MRLGLENKKQTKWAVALGVIAVLAVAYEFIPMFMGSSSSPDSSAHAAAPAVPRVTARTGGRAAKKLHVENLDPTLKLDLLASSEKTLYEGNNRNIFVSQAEGVEIPKPGAPGVTDAPKAIGIHYAPSAASASNSVEVFRLCQQEWRAQKDLSLAGRGRVRRG